MTIEAITFEEKRRVLVSDPSGLADQGRNRKISVERRGSPDYPGGLKGAAATLDADEAEADQLGQMLMILQVRWSVGPLVRQSIRSPRPRGFEPVHMHMMCRPQSSSLPYHTLAPTHADGERQGLGRGHAEGERRALPREAGRRRDSSPLLEDLVETDRKERVDAAYAECHTQ